MFAQPLSLKEMVLIVARAPFYVMNFMSHRDRLVLIELVNYQSINTIIHSELLQAITPLNNQLQA